MEKKVIYLRIEWKDPLGTIGLIPLVRKELSRSDSISEEGIEEDIVEGDDEVSVGKNLERNEKDYYQGNVHGNDDAIYSNGVRGTHSNIVGRCRFEWQGVECDLVNNGGVFIANVEWLHVTHMKQFLMIDLGKTMLGFASCIILQLYEQ